jgi:hypothetical protein
MGILATSVYGSLGEEGRTSILSGMRGIRVVHDLGYDLRGSDCTEAQREKRSNIYLISLSSSLESGCFFKELVCLEMGQQRFIALR